MFFNAGIHLLKWKMDVHSLLALPRATGSPDPPPNVAHNPDLEILNLRDNELAAPPDVAHNPRLQHVYLSNNRLVAPPDLSRVAYPRLTVLDLENNRLTALPDIRRCTGLEDLHLNDNALDCEWYTEALPATLTKLEIHNNPKLWGVLTKALVAQCTGRLRYSGCRRRDQCSAEEKQQLKYLQTPFFVGLTVASEDIESTVLLYIEELKIGLANMIDAPARGDASLDMCKTHGKAWTAWQEVSMSPTTPASARPAHAAHVFGANAAGWLPAPPPCCLPRTRPAHGCGVPTRPPLRHTQPGPARSPASPLRPTPFAAAGACCCRCPPQVWLKGLLALARGTTIWAIATEPHPRSGIGGHFKRKLEDSDRWASDGECRAACFDPCYRLPEGTRATSIMFARPILSSSM